jgi:hypothetical protein
MFDNKSKKISKAEIELIEQNLGIKFPVSFIEHYIHFNGGTPEKSYFYSEDSDIEIEVQLFLPLKYKIEEFDIDTVEHKYMLFQLKSELMKIFIPFANDYGANQICLNVNNGTIYIVYMDLGELSERCFKYLCEDFNTFVTGLSECSIDE